MQIFLITMSHSNLALILGKMKHCDAWLLTGTLQNFIRPYGVPKAVVYARSWFLI